MKWDEPMAVSWPQARQAARDATKPLDPIELPLDAALHTALAAPLSALVGLPACDTSAMDGYAVAGAGPWTVVGRVLAGGAPDTARLTPGRAVEVATGAPTPPGADAVLPVEHIRRTGDTIAGAAQPGRHIRVRGENFPEGQRLLPSGTTVTPAVLGLAASAGHDTLLVHRRPRVLAVLTGDELLRHGRPAPGLVRDAIGPMLPGLIRAAGAELSGTAQLADRADALTDLLANTDAEVIAVGGATSVGSADHLRRSLRALAADVLVGGVACRPGHPQLLAVLPDGRYVVGLPGNPFAALVAAVTLLQPLLGALGGHLVRPPLTAVLTGQVTAHPRDTVLLAAVRSGAGVTPVGHDRPASLWGAAMADALAVLPPGWTGPEVELLPLP